MWQIHNHHHYNGSIIVDYILADNTTLPQFMYFKIEDLIGDMSGHCILWVSCFSFNPKHLYHIKKLQVVLKGINDMKNLKLNSKLFLNVKKIGNF